MTLPDQFTECRRTLTIRNAKGLHARAANKVVKLAANYQAEIWVMRNGMVVMADSIMGLMMLGAANGETIEIWARGIQAAEAIEAIDQLVARKFDENA